MIQDVAVVRRLFFFGCNAEIFSDFTAFHKKERVDGGELNTRKSEQQSTAAFEFRATAMR